MAKVCWKGTKISNKNPDYNGEDILHECHYQKPNTFKCFQYGHFYQEKLYDVQILIKTGYLNLSTCTKVQSFVLFKVKHNDSTWDVCLHPEIAGEKSRSTVLCMIPLTWHQLPVLLLKRFAIWPGIILLKQCWDCHTLHLFPPVIILVYVQIHRYLTFWCLD